MPDAAPPGAGPGPSESDPRNRCRLYRNKGNGTFEDVAEKAGVTPEVRHIANTAGAITVPESRLDLAKAGVACIACEDGPRKGGGSLRWLVSADWYGPPAGGA